MNRRRVTSGCPMEVKVAVPCILAGGGGRHWIRLRFASRWVNAGLGKLETDPQSDDPRLLRVNATQLVAISCECAGREHATEVAEGLHEDPPGSCLHFRAAMVRTVQPIRLDRGAQEDDEELLEILPWSVQHMLSGARQNAWELHNARERVRDWQPEDLLAVAAGKATVDAQRIAGFGYPNLDFHELVVKITDTAPMTLWYAHYRVAERRRGVWQIVHEGMHRASRRVSYWDQGECPVCPGRAYQKLQKHTNSKRHIANFQEAIFRVLEELPIVRRLENNACVTAKDARECTHGHEHVADLPRPSPKRRAV